MMLFRMLLILVSVWKYKYRPIVYQLSRLLYSWCIGLFYKNVGILLGDCLTREELMGSYLEVVWPWRIKWGLFTGGGEVGFGGYWY